MFFTKQKYDKVLVPLLMIGLFLYASIQQKSVLGPEMPKEFVDAPSSGPAARQRVEEKIARAYWRCVVNDLQWKYGYGYTLPPDPPAEFVANTPEKGAENAETRARYWRQLRHVWYIPSVWHKRYEFDIGWVTNPALSVKNWVQDRLARLP
jgi:hypothetical protein